MDSVSRMRSRTFVVQVRVFLQVISCTVPTSQERPFSISSATKKQITVMACTVPVQLVMLSLPLLFLIGKHLTLGGLLGKSLAPRMDFQTTAG